VIETSDSKDIYAVLKDLQINIILLNHW